MTPSPRSRRAPARRRLRRLAAGLAAAGGSVALALVVGADAGPLAAVGARPPPNPRPEPFRPADYAGRLTLVHFWATWCAPCTEEIPSLVEFYRGPYPELRGRGLSLVTINNDVRRRDLHDYAALQPLPFPVYLDSLSELNQRFDLFGLPGTVVLGPDGRVVDRLLGPQDWQSVALLQRLEGYLAD